jgi:uncharacterized protein (TIGR03067 family)
MKKSTPAIMLGFLVVTFGAVAAPGPKEAKDDLKKLQGSWTIDSWQQLGQPIDIKGTWVFDGEKYTLDTGANIEEGTIKLDTSKKMQTIDLAITGGNCKGNDQPGIYKLDGDTVTLCFAWPGKTNRPDKFESSADENWILITMKRTKKDN